MLSFEHFGIAEGTVGLEYTFLTQSMMAMVTHPHAKPAGVVVKDCTPIMSELRLVKDADEIERIQAAANVAAAGMKAAVEAVRPGLTESQVAAEAEHAMRQAGAEEFWRSYVASGPRTSIAHGLPTSRKLEAGDLVMIDIHPIVGGYSANLTRTTVLGEPTREQRALFDAYAAARDAAMGALRPGIKVSELDKAAQRAVSRSGFDEAYVSGISHGIGLRVEETPALTIHPKQAGFALREGMTITVGHSVLGHGSLQG